MKNFKPMLAGKLENLNTLRFPLYVSPKIDGVRAVVRGGVVLSRSLKPIPSRSVQRLFGRVEFDGLDGELVIGSPNDQNVFQKTMSGVMSEHGIADGLMFLVFDYVTDSTSVATYEKRYHQATISVLASYTDKIQMLPHLRCEGLEEFSSFAERSLSCGFEGTMVRSPEGPYKYGRSTLKEGHLLKWKPFADGEAVVTGFVELEHNENESSLDERGYAKRSTSRDGKVAAGTLGALLVREVDTGRSFSLGGGFTAAQRQEIWDTRATWLGRIARFRHFSVTGVVDAPRFPVFAGWRDSKDMSE